MKFASESEISGQARQEAGNFLFFGVGEFVFALNLDYLVRVVDLSSEKGDGQVKAEIDLRSLLKIKSYAYSADGGEGFRIEMKSESGYYGLLADAIFGIKDFMLALPLEFPKALRNEENEVISGFFFDGHYMISILDPEKIFEMWNIQSGCSPS